MITKTKFIALFILGVVSMGLTQAQSVRPAANSIDPKVPAKELFGRMSGPVSMDAQAIGFYSRGCLAGAVELPVTGESWQVMRLSRNRNWGHPNLVRMLTRLAENGRKYGWPGLLIGDMAQPRGGPMLTGHVSHQVGLDADIWLTPMPGRVLTREERAQMSATNMVAADRKGVDPGLWTTAHAEIIKAAAQEPEVERIFVNAAIKKALCRNAGGDRGWLNKVRPWYGHNYHFHVRLRCPSGAAGCKPQDPVPAGAGCGKELEWWFRDEVLFPKPAAKPPKTPLTLADLPDACRQVVFTR